MHTRHLGTGSQADLFLALRKQFHRVRTNWTMLPKYRRSISQKEMMHNWKYMQPFRPLQNSVKRKDSQQMTLLGPDRHAYAKSRVVRTCVHTYVWAPARTDQNKSLKSATNIAAKALKGVPAMSPFNYRGALRHSKYLRWRRGGWGDLICG